MLKNKQSLKILTFTIIGIIAINWISETIYKRFDLTQDQRYTLSEVAKATTDPVDSPMVIEVFLDGELPPEFKRLQIETEQLLAEFAAYNPNVKYLFSDGNLVRQELEAELATAKGLIDQGQERIAQKTITEAELKALASNYQTAEKNLQVFSQLKGANVEIRENGKISNEMVYPWALASYNRTIVPIALLNNTLGATSEERVNNSIQNLEYAFADGFGKLTQPKKRKVAVLKGNDEMEDRYLADFISTLRDYYFIGQFTLDSVAASPQRTLRDMQGYDLVIVAQPQEPFTDAETYVLDQYTMNGGRSLWLIDATAQRLDTVSGNTFVFGQDLGLNDLFFKYGVRVKQNLVKAMPSGFMVLATGQERDAQYQKYPWLYSPLSSKLNKHPIVTNLEAVKFDYASVIDTLPNTLKKTVLLNTAPFSKIIGLPVEIDIDVEIPKNLKVINEGPGPEEFGAGEVPLAVLIEGTFPSVFANRVKPFKIENDKTESSPTKMVVVSDGDVIKNQLDRGRPLELGFDKWTNSFYGNKEFLLNTVNYLLDDNGLINIRTKEISVPFLDPQRTVEKRTQWQLINLLLPLGLLAVFGVLFQYLRKKKYAQTSTHSIS